jgi:hypothetical protein
MSELHHALGGGVWFCSVAPRFRIQIGSMRLDPDRRLLISSVPFEVVSPAGGQPSASRVLRLKRSKVVQVMGRMTWACSMEVCS